MKAAAQRDLSVGGPELAGRAFAADLFSSGAISLRYRIRG
jgi:hypothetical protein